MARIDEKVARLEKELKQAKALKQKQDALIRTAENSKKRKMETSLKILLGAATLSAIKKGSVDKTGVDHLFSLLDETDRKRLRDAFATLGIEILAPKV